MQLARIPRSILVGAFSYKIMKYIVAEIGYPRMLIIVCRLPRGNVMTRRPCLHLCTHLTQFGCHQTLDKLSKCLSNIARSISLLSNYIFQDARENDLLHQLLIRPRAYHNTHQTANSRNIWYLFHYFLFFLICRALCRAEFKVAREWSVEWLTLSYVKSLKNFLNIFS